MNPGELDQRIAIKNPSGFTKNEAGEKVPSMVLIANTWAKVEPDAGGEVTKDEDKVHAEIKYTVKIRYRKDVTEKMIIEWDHTILEIQAVLPFKRKGETILKCVEKVK